MTIDHPIRRFLARFCSADTMAAVVDPTLADMRFEDGRPSWRGCVALVRALALHRLVSLPGSLSRLWTDDEHALPRAAVAGLVTTVILGALLILPPVLESPGRPGIGVLRTIVLLAPQSLGLVLPAALLVAIPTGFRGTARPRLTIARGLALGVVCAVATFVVINQVMPDANQAWREEVRAQFGGGTAFTLERGPNELAFHELSERIDRLRLMPGHARLARTLEHTYQMRLMLAMIAVPLGIFGVAMALSIRGPIRAVLAGIAATIVYVSVLFPLEYAGLRLMKQFEAIPPAVVVWAPALAFLIVSAVVLRRSMRRALAISA